MNKTEIFQVLGIDETKDEKLIKEAYRARLAVTNPEDNPEGFKRLRTAYEEACVYAKSEEEEKVQEEDTTPSGLWVQKVAAIYGNMEKRRNVECWETLFEDDIFLSLEEEENCCNKLLRFLMGHFKLPTDVWKLLDRKIHIINDAARIREYFPADFVNYIISRCRQGEDIEFEQFEGAPEADYDLFIQYSDKCWEALREGQLEQAQEYLQNADDLQIYHPIMELSRALLWEKQGKIDEAVEWMKKLEERYDNDLMVTYHTAEMLWRNERGAEAATFYESILKGNEKHYMANRRLAEWYCRSERYKDAKKCAEEVIGMGGAEEMRTTLEKINHELEKELEEKHKGNPGCESGLELGWCYLQDGRFCEGIRLALSLEDYITKEKESEYKGLLTKLYVESAEYKKAIEMAEIWEEALKEKISEEQGEDKEQERKKDEDRVRQSYAIRVHSYHKLAYKEKEYYEKAIEAIDKVVAMAKEDAPEIHMLLEKAQIYTEMNEYEKALDITTELVEKYQIYAAYATAQKAYSRLWDAQGVVKTGYECIRCFPEYAQSYERIAKVYLDLKYDDDFQRIIEEAEKANIKSVFLEAYAYQKEHEVPDDDELNKRIKDFRENYMKKLEDGYLGYYEKALPIMNENLYARPGSYMLVERALFYREAGKYELAEEDFERALSEEPDNPYAYNGLAFMYRMQGQYEKALICIKKAILYYEEEFVRPYSEMGDLYTLLGLHEMAIQAYEQALRVGGEKIRKNSYYMRRYAHSLARNNRVSEAISVINESFENSLERYEQLTELYHKLNDEPNARKILKRWHDELFVARNADKTWEKAEYYDSLAWTEFVCGDVNKAIEYFEKEAALKGETADNTGLFSDLVFACALNGNDKKAMIYAKKLKDYIEKKQQEGINLCHEMDKIALEREFITKYFVATKEELEDVISRIEKTNVCYFCVEPACKEVEAMRILHLLRMEKTEEAFAWIERILEKNPLDEWMHSIKNVCRNGIKVIPYSVNGQLGHLMDEGEEAINAYFDSRTPDRSKSAGKTVRKVLAGIFKR